MKKKVISFVSIIILTMITFYIVLSSNELVAFPKLMELLNPIYIGMAFGCVLLYSVLNAVLLYTIAHEIAPEISFKRALYLAFLGQYYGMITPLYSGSQPAQIMAMKTKYDVSIVTATTITIKKHIVYQVVLSLLATFLYLYDMDYIHQHYAPATIVLILIGLIGNFVMALGIILLAYTDVWVKKLLTLLLKIAHRLKLLKKLSVVELNKQVDEFVKNIDDIKKNRKAMIGLIGVTLLQNIVYFSVTYFVYLAVGETGARYVDILSVQVLVYMIASFIPTPGNAGASEGGFYVVFQPFFNAKILPYVMAIWRLITFYGLMLLSGLVVLVVKVYEVMRLKSSVKPLSE